MAYPSPAYNDLRGQLPFNARSPYRRRRQLSDLQYNMGHYSADRMPATATQAQEIEHLRGIARYHQQKDWSTDGSGAHGWTIMYAYAIFQSGRIYICNDEEEMLWSVTDGNYVALSTVLILGQGEEPSDAMLATLQQHFDHLCFGRPDLPGIVQARTFGHGETPAIYGEGPNWRNNTDCPGEALGWVRSYRAGQITPPPDPQPAPDPNVYRFFPETGHTIGHGFKEFWEGHGGLEIFGFPLSEEKAEVCEDGVTRTVQWFERACFEYHDDMPEGMRVQLRRLGAMMMNAGPQVAVECACGGRQ